MSVEELALACDADKEELRTKRLFQDFQFDVASRTDRSFVWLMLAQWLLSIPLAVFVSPYTWIGESSFVHVHVWLAAGFGGVLSSFPILMAYLKPGSVWTRHTMAVAQGVWTAFLIHLTGGRIETHFHAFGSMAFLAFYRDWRVLITATLVVVADHVVRGSFWPLSVYGVALDSTYRFVEHAAWLTWLDIFLVASCFRHQREAYDICRRRAELECANAEVEDRVQLRTQELQATTQELEAEYRAREELYSELLVASRKAGKAEVATGVLHNVGNVLNSLNVSGQMLAEKVSRSPVDKLVKAAEILKQQDDMCVFLQDERGRHFPQVIEQLSEKLEQCRQDQIGEINDLMTSLEHVRKIVAAQQVVARDGSQVLENLDLNSLVDDAIRISGIESKPDVELRLNGQFEVLVSTDRHKVLQILINLLNNAEQAGRCRKQQAWIEVELKRDSGYVQVVVRDNGHGISQEKLTKIFQHGFTTKADGHGFGLHSCALAAKSLGGSLSVSSKGLDLGAAFTLTLPILAEASIPTMESILN